MVAQEIRMVFYVLFYQTFPFIDIYLGMLKEQAMKDYVEFAESMKSKYGMES